MDEAFYREMGALMSLVDEADYENEKLAEAVGELEVRMGQLMDCLLIAREQYEGAEDAQGHEVRSRVGARRKGGIFIKFD